MSKKGLYGVNTYRERSRKKIGRHKKNLNKSQKPYKKYRGQGRQGVDKYYINDYIGFMKEINIKVKNISQKQWSLLLVELNLVSQNWRRYGPVMNIKATKRAYP